MKPTTDDWGAPLFWGALGVGIAATCGAMDAINNYRYGIAFNGMAATGLLMAAALVVIIPGMAARNGWSLLKYSVIAVALGLTLWAGYSQYETSQRELRTSTQNRQDEYLRANEKRDVAKARLTKNKENGQVDQLAILAQQADSRFAQVDKSWTKACRRPWLRICTTATSEKKRAEAAQIQAHERLSNAQSRDKAERDLAAAEAEMAKGAVVVREENSGVVYGLLALTQGGALLGGEGFVLLMLGLRGRKEWRAKQKRQKTAPTPPDGGGEELPDNVVSLDLVRASVKQWLDKSTVSVPGGEIRGGEVYRLYKRSRGAVKDASAEAVKAALAVIYGVHSVENRTSGYVLLGRALRAVSASQKRSAAR